MFIRIFQPLKYIFLRATHIGKLQSTIKSYLPSYASYIRSQGLYSVYTELYIELLEKDTMLYSQTQTVYKFVLSLPLINEGLPLSMT